MNELQLQSQCFLWSWNTIPSTRGKIRRIKNEIDRFTGSSRAVAQITENKATGVVPGTWDIMVMRNPMTWIEMKTKTGRLSAAQIEFMEIGKHLGHEFYVVKSFEDWQLLIARLFAV